MLCALLLVFITPNVWALYVNGTPERSEWLSALGDFDKTDINGTRTCGGGMSEGHSAGSTCDWSNDGTTDGEFCMDLMAAGYNQGLKYFWFGLSAAGKFEADYGDGYVETINRTNNTTFKVYKHTYTKETGADPNKMPAGYSHDNTGVRTARFCIRRKTGPTEYSTDEMNLAWKNGATVKLPMPTISFSPYLTGDNTDINYQWKVTKIYGGLSGSRGVFPSLGPNGNQNPAFTGTFLAVVPYGSSLSFNNVFHAGNGTIGTRIGQFAFAFAGVGSLFANLMDMTTDVLSSVNGATRASMFLGTFAGYGGKLILYNNTFGGLTGKPQSRLFENTFSGTEISGQIPSRFFGDDIYGVASTNSFTETFKNCTYLGADQSALPTITSDPENFVYASFFKNLLSVSSASGVMTDIFKGTALPDKCPKGVGRVTTVWDDYWTTTGSTKAIACEPCEKGYYKSTVSADACKMCDSGYYSDTEGSITCKSCPAGKYSLDGASSCTPCPAGTYNDQPNGRKNSCRNCPGGTISSAGATQCTECGSGEYSNAGHTACESCPFAFRSNEAVSSIAWCSKNVTFVLGDGVTWRDRFFTSLFNVVSTPEIMYYQTDSDVFTYNSNTSAHYLKPIYLNGAEQPARGRYRFNRWKYKTLTMLNPSTVEATTDLTVAVNITAEWYYRVQYNPNGASGSSTAKKVISGNSYTALSDTDTTVGTKSGFSFDGWCIESRSTNTTYGWMCDNPVQAGQTICDSGTCISTINQNDMSAAGYVHLHARWVKECPAGQYLPANQTTCATCDSGYWCPGGKYQQSTQNQGINKCSETSGIYTRSNAGSDEITDCFARINFYPVDSNVYVNGTAKPVGGSFKTISIHYKSGWTDSSTYSPHGQCKSGDIKFCEAKRNSYYLLEKSLKTDNVFNITRTGFSIAGFKKYESGKAVGNLIKLGTDAGEGTTTAQPSGNVDLFNNPNTPTINLAVVWNVHCDAGKYLPAGSEVCATCPAGGYWCPEAGDYLINQSEDQGKNECPVGYNASSPATGNILEDRCLTAFVMHHEGISWTPDNTYANKTPAAMLYAADSLIFNYTDNKHYIKTNFLETGNNHPVKPGYTFTGWKWQSDDVDTCPNGYDKDCTGTDCHNAGCKLSGSVTTCPTGWTEVIAGQLCVPNDKLTKLTDTTNIIVGNQQQIYSMWEPNQYTVTYSCGTGNAVSGGPGTQSVTFNTIFSAKSATGCEKSGFGGFYWDCTYDSGGANLNNGSLYSNASTATCVAKYQTPNQTVVKYVCLADNKTDETDIATYNTPYTFKTFATFCPNTDVPDGFEYAGNQFICTDNEQHSGDTVNQWTYTGALYTCTSPEIQHIDYTIHFDLDNGTLDGNTTNTIEYNTAENVRLSDPTRDNCNFVGWCLYSSAINSGKSYLNTDNDHYVSKQDEFGSVIAIQSGATGDRWAYAKWECDIDYDDVENNWTNDSMNPSKYVVNDTPVKLKDPIKQGSDFVGWCIYDASSNSGSACSDSSVAYVAPQTVTENIIAIASGVTGPKWVYAKWDKRDYTVKYYCDDYDDIINGRTPDYSAIQTFETEFVTSAGASATCSSTGHAFAGWKCNYLVDAVIEEDSEDLYALGDDLANNDTYSQTTDSVCVAQWTPKIYKVILDATTNGGGPDSVIYEEYKSKWKNADFETVLNVSKPTKDRSLFAGYYLTSTGSGDAKILSSGVLPATTLFDDTNTTPIDEPGVDGEATLYARFNECQTPTIGANVNASSLSLTVDNSSRCVWSADCNVGYHAPQESEEDYEIKYSVSVSGTFHNLTLPDCVSNTINLGWVDGDKRYTAEEASNSCIYNYIIDQLPTAPVKTGYTFKGWDVIDIVE